MLRVMERACYVLVAATGAAPENCLLVLYSIAVLRLVDYGRQCSWMVWLLCVVLRRTIRNWEQQCVECGSVTC